MIAMIAMRWQGAGNNANEVAKTWQGAGNNGNYGNELAKGLKRR